MRRRGFRRDTGLRLSAVTSLLLIQFLLFCGQSTCQAQDRPSAPVLEIDSQSHDFGAVVEGQQVSHDFIIRNSGGSDLIIQRIVPSCGCTVASSSASQIPSGEEGKVSVQFDTTGFSGDKVKMLKLFSNAPDTPVLDLTIRGRVETELLIEPRSINFGEVTAGASAERSLDIKVRSGSSVRINGFKTFSKFIKVEDIQKGELARKAQVRLDAPLSAGLFRDRVLVELEDGKSVNLPVTASIQDALKLSPPRLSFGVISPDGKLERKVKLEYSGDGQAVLRGFKSKHPAVKVSSKTIEEGRNYVLTVELDPKMIEGEELRTDAEIRLDRSGVGETILSLAIYGILPPRL